MTEDKQQQREQTIISLWEATVRYSDLLLKFWLEAEN